MIVPDVRHVVSEEQEWRGVMQEQQVPAALLRLPHYPHHVLHAADVHHLLCTVRDVLSPSVYNMYVSVSSQCHTNIKRQGGPV